MCHKETLMTALNRQQSRDVDRLATENLGISGLTLMENAGRACTDAIAAHQFSSVMLLCGKGNNAGDGFVIARHLLTREIPAIIIQLVNPESLSGDALTNYEILTKLPTTILFVDETNIVSALDELATDSNMAIIDCMMGTGGQGAPRPPFRQAIEWANRQPAFRIAIDIPSGLDCDTGQAGTPTFQAQQTLTMVATKIGFSLEAARQFTGNVSVIDIGIPLSSLPS